MTKATGSNLSGRKQQMWVYVIAGLFVCDFVLCGYLPSRQRLAALEQMRARQRQTIERAGAQSGELVKLEWRVRTMEAAVKDYDRRVPAERTLGTFLQQVAGIMTDCQLGEQVVLPGKEWKTDRLSCVPIHVACRGTLASVFDFLTKLQSLDRLVRLEKVTLENDADLTGRIGVQVEAVIFEQSAPRGGTGGPVALGSTGGSNHGV